ncbi:ribosome silencing factor RsfS/YbeB/iojap [Brockia lithotrophica]|uniref:Ribosomal silencing factor RsfS n=1 Tax=Brockia lithotrophica TaxID=933949 RepID=A0A660L7U4_9BACL|nr:ribosome silencing factor RsfS/YbeB/iojap [Brockia lithotrophica]
MDLYDEERHDLVRSENSDGETFGSGIRNSVRGAAEGDARAVAVSLGNAALAKKGEDVLLLDVRGLTLIADYFLLVTGKNRVHVRALSDAVEEEARKVGRRARRTEGLDEGRWVLLDYGDVIVHLFTEEERAYYQLERLWGDAPRELLGGGEADPQERSVHP